MEDTDHNKSKDSHNGEQQDQIYKVEKVVGKRVRKYGKSKPRTEYQIKWIGWGPEWNQWVAKSDCAGAAELIKEFETMQTAP